MSCFTSNSEVRSKEYTFTPPFREGPFKLYQSYLESVQTLHEIEVWSTISNMFIHANVLELQGSSLYHVMNEMIADLYVLQPVMEYRIHCHLYAALFVT